MNITGQQWRNRKKSIVFLCAVFSCPAYATQWEASVLGFEPSEPGVFGDMLGLRSDLARSGFNFNLAYLSQSAVNTGGGYNRDRKLAYIDQFALTFSQSLQQITGIPDATIEGNIVNRNHNNNLTAERLQNPALPFNDLAQESWGGQSITRLGWLTFSRSFFERRLFWRIGMMNKVQTFDQSIPCDFQMLTQCGGKSANALLWNNWNVHSWGTTLEYKLTPEVTLKGGIMEQNPRAADRNRGWSLSARGSRGVLLPLEVELKTTVKGLPGLYNAGVLLTNASQPHLSRGKSQQDGSRDPLGYRSYGNTAFIWASANQQVTSHKDNKQRGMSLSWSGSLADHRTNPIQLTSAISMRYRGLFDSRPRDWLGLGVSYIRMSHYGNEKYAFARVASLPTVAGYPNISSSVNAELYYRFTITPWLQVQPDIQYWHNPAGDRNTADGWVAGLKTVVVF